MKRFRSLFHLLLIPLFVLGASTPAHAKPEECFGKSFKRRMGFSEFNPSTMNKMIEGLKRAQNVSIEYDTTMDRARGKVMPDRNTIFLASKSKNALTQATLFHEAVHTTTNFKMQSEQTPERCAQGVRFTGALFSAPAGYRTGFRVDEIMAHQKEVSYLNQLANSADASYLSRKNLLSYAKEQNDRAQVFQSTSLELLSRIEESFSAFEKNHPGKTYPFQISDRPNAPAILNVTLRFDLGPNQPLSVEVPIPAAKEFGGRSPSFEEIVRLSRKVLSAARAAAQKSP